MNSRSLALAASATVVASGAAGSRADAPSPVRGGGACVWAIWRCKRILTYCTSVFPDFFRACGACVQEALLCSA